MNVLNPRGLVFAFNCTLAALLSLAIAFGAGLANPWWAALTVFITSQPMAAASGAVVARALWRIAGTVVGVAAALVILPALVDTPALLITAVAAWVGVCLFLSLLDRTPRGYALMLAGYTVAFVGLPLIGDPSAIFDTAVARAEEIGIGAVCAALVHTLSLPRSVKAMLDARLAATLADARTWISGALSPDTTPPGEQAARRKIAADLTELNTLAAHVRYETGGSAALAGTVVALEERLVALLPLMSAVEDRLDAMTKDGAFPGALSLHVAEVRRWIDEGVSGDDDRVEPLVEAGRSALRAADDASPWIRMLAASLVQRLEALVRAWGDSVQLARSVDDPHRPVPARLQKHVAEAARRPLHVDPGLAAYAGFAAAVAVVLTAGLAAVTGWPQGVVAVGIAAAGSSVFAFIDDPRPMQRTLIVSTFVSAPVAALYAFAILPAVDGFGLLAAALSPLFFATALYLATPRYWLPALGFALVSQTLIALQGTSGADFITFTTATVAALAGAVIALMVTALIRVIGAELSAWRILRAGWQDLAALARGRGNPSVRAWTSRMLDRVALSMPRLARAGSVERLRDVDALNDLRAGINVADLRAIAADTGPSTAPAIDRVLREVAAHFASQRRHAHVAPGPALLGAIDAAVGALLRIEAADLRRRALAAAAGLRRGLFPDAPPYRREEPAS